VLEQHQPDWNSPADKAARENNGLELIALGGQRFVGVSQADETQGGTSVARRTRCSHEARESCDQTKGIERF
jgi:hypothetical protein